MYIIVIGCGRVGVMLAGELSREGHQVVVIDNDEARLGNLHVLDHLAGPLGDPHRLIADALQVARDLHGRDNPAQVRGDRLEQHENLDPLVVDADFQLVNLLVTGNGLSAEFAVPLEKPPHRGFKIPHHDLGHAAEVDVQLIKGALEVSKDVNRLVRHGVRKK